MSPSHAATFVAVADVVIMSVNAAVVGVAAVPITPAVSAADIVVAADAANVPDTVDTACTAIASTDVDGVTVTIAIIVRMVVVGVAIIFQYIPILVEAPNHDDDEHVSDYDDGYDDDDDEDDIEDDDVNDDAT